LKSDYDELSAEYQAVNEANAVNLAGEPHERKPKMSTAAAVFHPAEKRPQAAVAFHAQTAVFHSQTSVFHARAAVFHAQILYFTLKSCISQPNGLPKGSGVGGEMKYDFRG
jgi:hypothetical protein